MSFIKRKTKYNDIKLKEIQYGLEGIYLTITKLIVIFSLAMLLKIFKEMLIFLILFNIIRTTAFGLHATKSWICLICSIITFILIPVLSLNIVFNIYFKIILSAVCILLMFKNSPADTHKRPIVSKKRRNAYKFISTVIAIIYSLCIIIINNNFISNSLLLSLIVENLLIAPLIYKVFKLPYNNYIEYLKQHPDIIIN